MSSKKKLKKRLRQLELDIRILLADVGEPAVYDHTDKADRVWEMRERYGFSPHTDPAPTIEWTPMEGGGWAKMQTHPCEPDRTTVGDGILLPPGTYTLDELRALRDRLGNAA
ncbi:hypothetical protein [Nocardia otitidiscaviarum]|uniref:hypothetical protein n=1 Tax=Nocardia otitidiscaviarum TaxID=1823 RepID=UPI0024570242|nr:hypothetical protein [Nocardia otitidiscaviarum]